MRAGQNRQAGRFGAWTRGVLAGALGLPLLGSCIGFEGAPLSPQPSVAPPAVDSHLPPALRPIQGSTITVVRNAVILTPGEAAAATQERCRAQAPAFAVPTCLEIAQTVATGRDPGRGRPITEGLRPGDVIVQGPWPDRLALRRENGETRVLRYPAVPSEIVNVSVIGP